MISGQKMKTSLTVATEDGITAAVESELDHAVRAKNKWPSRESMGCQSRNDERREGRIDNRAAR